MRDHTTRSRATYCHVCGHELEDAEVLYWCPRCEGPRKPQKLVDATPDRAAKEHGQTPHLIVDEMENYPDYPMPDVNPGGAMGVDDPHSTRSQAGSRAAIYREQAAEAARIVASWPESMRKAIWPPRKEYR